MIYSFERIKKQLQYHKKLYLVLMLEIIIGVVIFVSCINIFLSWVDQTEKLKRERIGKEMTVMYVETLGQEAEDLSESAIRYTDYKNLKKKYKKDLDLTYACESRVTYAINLGKKTEFIDFNSFFMDESMYENFFESQMKSGNIYMGADIYQKVKTIIEKKKKGEKVILMEGGFFEINKNGIISLNGSGKFSPKRIVNNRNIEQIQHPSIYAKREENFRVDNCVILPIKFVKYAEQDLNGWKILKLKYKDTSSKTNKVPCVLADLAKAHGEYYSYSVPDKYMNIEEKIDSASFSIEKYFYASVCILAIIMIGMIGVMVLFLNQRKYSIAIEIAYGATFKRVFGELFAEILLVFEVGGIIGLILSAFIIPYIRDAAYSLNTFHIVSGGFLVLIMALCAFFVSVFSILGVNKISPVQTLKEL